MPSKAFGQNRKLGTRERSELFVARRRRQTRLQWTDVDQVLLLTALDVCMAEGVTISFAPAQGGIGITLRIYHGNKADVEFAGSTEELEELLGLVIDGFGSSSEDPREVIRMALSVRKEMAAD